MLYILGNVCMACVPCQANGSDANYSGYGSERFHDLLQRSVIDWLKLE